MSVSGRNGYSDGESREVEVIFPKGHPNNRMSPVEVETKFRAGARGRMPSARQEKVIGKARELEKLASLAELMNDLAEGETGLNRP